MLDPINERHLYALHYTYLPHIIKLLQHSEICGITIHFVEPITNLLINFLSRHQSAETLCWLWYVVVVGLISIFMRSNAHALEL